MEFSSIFETIKGFFEANVLPTLKPIIDAIMDLIGGIIGGIYSSQSTSGVISVTPLDFL